MTSIQLTLTGAQARAEVDGLLTSGMVGVPVSITWDESWNGLVKTLVCRSDGCVRTSLNVGHQATVAPEVLRTERWSPNSLYLGVEGRDAEGNLIIPSTFAYCGQILPGAVTEGTISEEPENPAWAQILGLIGDMGALATSQRETLVSAINEAAGQGGQGATEMTVSAGYQLSSSRSEIPTGAWSTSIPATAAGKYLWTKITLSREGGTTTSVYSVSGSVTSVNGAQPDGEGNVTLTAAQVGAVPLTGGTMTGPLNVLTPSGDGNAANKGYVDTKVRQAAPGNLLDNPDFRNPVNQRGGTSYPSGSYRYTLDRWYASKYIGVELSDDGVTISGEGSGDSYYGFSQRIPYSKAPKSGAAFTFAVYCADGTTGIFSGVVPATGGATKVGQGGTVIANVYAELSFASTDYAQLSVYVKNGKTLQMAQAALYEGEYTADTLPDYNTKGYGSELLECQRYYVRIVDDSGPPQGFGFAVNTGNVRIMVPLNVQMRNTPTITFIGTHTIEEIRLFSSGGEVNPTNMLNVSVRNCGLHFQFGVSDATINIPFVMRSMYLECSADL